MAQDQDQNKDKGGSMTVEEAGRLGGEKVKRERGSEFYSEIGKKGGEARSQDEDVQSGELGRKGGQARGDQNQGMGNMDDMGDLGDMGETDRDEDQR